MKKMSNTIIASLLLAGATYAYAEEIKAPAKEENRTKATVDVTKCGRPVYPRESVIRSREKIT